MDTLVLIVVCLGLIAFVDGVVLGFDVTVLFFKGIITLVIGGLGLLLGIGLTLSGIYYLISGG
tara:strand:+ start:604 stop:792 length:189 start_codon:yes stop_codon:yes gene_type:complete